MVGHRHPVNNLHNRRRLNAARLPARGRGSNTWIYIDGETPFSRSANSIATAISAISARR